MGLLGSESSSEYFLQGLRPREAIWRSVPRLIRVVGSALITGLAEGERFELSVGCPTAVFKAAVLNPSANLPVFPFTAGVDGRE